MAFVTDKLVLFRRGRELHLAGAAQAYLDRHPLRLMGLQTNGGNPTVGLKGGTSGLGALGDFNAAPA